MGSFKSNKQKKQLISIKREKKMRVVPFEAKKEQVGEQAKKGASYKKGLSEKCMSKVRELRELR